MNGLQSARYPPFRCQPEATRHYRQANSVIGGARHDRGERDAHRGAGECVVVSVVSGHGAIGLSNVTAGQEERVSGQVCRAAGRETEDP
jgi:hypothetical protein